MRSGIQVASALDLPKTSAEAPGEAAKPNLQEQRIPRLHRRIFDVVTQNMLHHAKNDPQPTRQRTEEATPKTLVTKKLRYQKAAPPFETRARTTCGPAQHAVR
jgi:hypothetical protein